VTGQKFWRKYGSIITSYTTEGERPVHYHTVQGYKKEKKRDQIESGSCLVTQQRTVCTLPEENSEILPETLFRKLFMPVKESNNIFTKKFPPANFLTFTYTLVDFSTFKKGWTQKKWANGSEGDL
jgi:hypothetical protein